MCRRAILALIITITVKTIALAQPFFNEAESPFCIIITAYNTSQWYKKNLDSVFSQDYPHFRVICIDDNSCDNTGTLIDHYICECKIGHRITFIKNKTRQRKTANMFTAYNLCHNKERIVILDGDDWFASKNALSRINLAYKEHDCWVTFGNFINQPAKNPQPLCFPIPPECIEKNLFRTWNWEISGNYIPGHPFSSYAGLLKQIKPTDLLYNGTFAPVCSDNMLLFPLLEMARKHIAFISDILYIRNISNPINDAKQDFALMNKINKLTRSYTPYSEVTAPY